MMLFLGGLEARPAQGAEGGVGSGDDKADIAARGDLFSPASERATSRSGQVGEFDSGRVDRAGFTGTGYVTGFTGDASLTLPIKLAHSGPHQTTIRYASPWGDKMTRLLVDGVDQAKSLSRRPQPLSRSTVCPPLAAGSHKLTLVSDWGYYDIDRVDVDFVHRRWHAV
jgi:mannan endo-1,4-beta-mannosidase